MDLFEIKNGMAAPTVHALTIEPYKTIWENDKSKNKSEAYKAFTFIELMCSRKKSNPFIGYEESIRYSKVAKNVYGDELARPTNDSLIEVGIELFKQLQLEASPSLSYLETALNSAENLKEYLNTVDLGERTNGGAAVYKPADITRALKETPDVIKTLKTLVQSVQTELEEEVKTRGKREIGLFER